MRSRPRHDAAIDYAGCPDNDEDGGAERVFHLLGDPGNRWWWETDGCAYYNEAGSRLTVQTGYKIHRQCTAKRWLDLDWSVTCLTQPTSQQSGWLSPEGSFHECPSTMHNLYAHYILRQSEYRLERLGWARILSPKHFTLGYGYGEGRRRPTADQKHWLTQNGYRYEDDGNL